MSGWIEYKLNRRNEIILYVALGVIGAGLRLYRLGDAPMSKTEAAAALSALQLVSNGAEISLNGRLPLSPLLHTLQAITFWLGGSATASLARLWPAMAGSLLVVVLPILLRRKIGRGASLVSALLLAVSPVAWAVSRTGDGMTLALLCGLLMAFGWQVFTVRLERRGLMLAAVALGAGLAAGPYFVTILLLGAVFSILRQGSLRSWCSLLAPEVPKAFQAAALSFIIGATACLIYPMGLAAAGESWFTWLSSWLPVAGQRPILLIPALVTLHEPVSLLLGLTGAYLLVRGDLVVKGLVALAGLGLLFCVAYGGRQSPDIVWVLVPVTLLTAIVVVKAWSGAVVVSELFVVCWQVAALSMLVGFGYVIIASFASGRSSQWLAGGWDAALQLAILLILGVLVVLLFATGWTRLMAWNGTVTTMFIVLLGWSAHSRTLLASGLTEDGLDIWYVERTSVSADIMLESVADISLRSLGESRDVEIAVLGEMDSRLAWLLREYRNVKWIRVPSNGMTSPVVIGPGGASTVAPGVNYLGQQFGYNVRRHGGPSDSIGWAKYLLFRRGPVRQTQLVLWVREDVKMAMDAAG